MALQEAFFSRKQREGETLLEFSLALMGLWKSVEEKSPYAMPNSETLVRDQFVEHVIDSALRPELKQLVRRLPSSSLLEVRSEALRWEREGLPGGDRRRSQSVPLVPVMQYGVQGGSSLDARGASMVELSELRDLLKSQQAQLNQLSKSVTRLQMVAECSQAPRARSQSPHPRNHSSRGNTIICRRCQRPGHFARECDGERVPPHPPSSRMVPPVAGGGQPFAQQLSELAPAGLQSHSSVGVDGGSKILQGSRSVSSLMSSCPHLVVCIGGVQVPCLIDTGSMVSTITESCFLQNFEPWGQDRLRSCQWLQLRAANGLDIPYIGYMELDVELCGRLVPGCGVLVVRDPPGGLCSQAPGVLGMNVLSRCYQELFGQHGSSLFESPSLVKVPSIVTEAFQYCHKVCSQSYSTRAGSVRVRGRRVQRIPGGMLQLVTATCSEQFLHDTVLFEPPESGLPAGLLASPSLVQVNRGIVSVPVVNVGTTDIVLYPRTHLGTLTSFYVVSLPSGVTEVKTISATVNVQVSHELPTVEEQIKATDLSVLSLEDQERVQALLWQYQSVFSVHEGDLGCTTLLSHEIPLMDDTPVRQWYRRIPPSEYEVVKAHINMLLEAKVIRESCSPYASPIVLVKKKDGSLRMCVDYRQLNARTRKDAFPLPRIAESLDSLTGARWFSTMDLASGYNQVPVSEQDRPKTAFCMPFGLFEWNRMPFGLCNAPSTFQRLMQRLFGDQQCQSLLLYLDDIVIFSSSVEQHLERLELVLSRLQCEGLKAKLEKCAFFRSEVTYLGHVISADGVSTDPKKTEAVVQWPQPTSVSELRSFLGFASYYRHFVEGFAKLAAPLHRLVAEFGGTKSRKRAEPGFASGWTTHCQRSFESLKGKLISAPVLCYADFSLPFILEVDASLGGLGAVLSQEQGGKVRPVAYASRGLRPTERNMSNYSSMKLEFLALKWAMAEKFREYLLGHKCVVYTDNNPLSHLTSAKLGATEQRWASQIACFDFEVKYRPGRCNKNADALSRQNPPVLEVSGSLFPGTGVPASVRQAVAVPLAPVACQAVVTALPGHSLDHIGGLQEADPVIGEILGFWRKQEFSGPLSQAALILLRQWDRLVEKQGVIYRRIFRPDGGDEILQVVLPSVLQRDVLQGLHQEHGHQGIERTTELVCQRCYWPGMTAKVA